MDTLVKRKENNMGRRKKTIAEIKEEIQENIRCKDCCTPISSTQPMYKLPINFDFYWCGKTICAENILTEFSELLNFGDLVSEAQAKS
jgi:hypothetical protein